jgi:hypothetical protein
MEEYALGHVTPPQPPPRELPEFGWLRAHYRAVAQEARFSSLDAEAQWERLTRQILDSDSAMEWQALAEVPAARRSEVLAWLRRTSDVPTAVGLTLRAIAHVGKGPDLYANRRAIQFEVLGMPLSQQAWIADFQGGWRILRVIDGVQGDWSKRPYATKEDALNNLAELVDSEPVDSKES